MTDPRGRNPKCRLCRVGQHVFHAKRGRHEVVLVGSGKRCYLWVGTEWPGESPRDRATAHGPATLRKLAKAILAEVGRD